MDWARPAYSLSRVDKAGKALASQDDAHLTIPIDLHNHRKIMEHNQVLQNWRSSHQFPLNTFQVTLRRKSEKISKEFIVSQRIKRNESIMRKLRSGTMQLSQMQDIGGCRSVLASVQQVRRLHNLYKVAEFEHEFKNLRDYIDNPKPDGYRSIHLIYRYQSSGNASCYNGHQIELQLRTAYQHAWATAVEAVGTFTQQALKWKGGDEDWKRFFILMSAGIALLENCPVPKDVPLDHRGIAREIRHLSQQLNVVKILQTYNLTLNYIGSLKQSKARLMLVKMEPDTGKVFVEGFLLRESQLADQRYNDVEKQIANDKTAQAVLVKVDSVKQLQKAYPNYFLDTRVFSNIMTKVIEWA